MQAASRLRVPILAILLALTASLAALAQEPPRPLGQAMDALREGNWDTAARLALRDGPEAADIVEWHRLRDGQGSAADVVAFLARNPDWPGLDWLRRRSEEAIAEADTATILDFFSETVPQTGIGALAHARALAATGELGAAQAGIVLAWHTLPLSRDAHAEFLADHAPVLGPHHAARLDMALWKGWEDNAADMLPLVGEDWRKLAAARRALAEDRPGVDTLIAQVPETLRDDAGLAYERFAWRARRGRADDAIALMQERSDSAERLGRPDAWAPLRRSLTRSLMRRGELERAYALAASHHTLSADGYAHSDLEWLSGYLALRLGRPETAATHFRRFGETVQTPISRGRAGYWLGRALEAAGQTEAAGAAYAEGARYQSSFYGLLAAERGGLPFDATLAGRERFPDWRTASFTESSVYRAGVLLLAAGELTLGERFLTHLAERLDEQDLNRLGAMLEDIGQPHVAVMVGKRAATAGLTIPAPYFALHPMAQAPWPVPAELALAIARRESEFDPVVISGAGARGLMQLMPGTAQDMARAEGLAYDAQRLLTDPDYNARLGTAYLVRMIEMFDGNPVLVAAAYNAGPTRPLRWMEEYGDPRRDEVDIVDWIEGIPFRETRNYIMRVTESLPVYRARLGRDPHPISFSEELKGASLLPD